MMISCWRMTRQAVKLLEFFRIILIILHHSYSYLILIAIKLLKDDMLCCHYMQFFVGN